MTGPKVNSEICFPKTLNVARGEALNDWPQGKERPSVFPEVKHLMTGPRGKSNFFFRETLNVPRGEAESPWELVNFDP